MIKTTHSKKIAWFLTIDLLLTSCIFMLSLKLAMRLTAHEGRPKGFYDGGVFAMRVKIVDAKKRYPFSKHLQTQYFKCCYN